MCSRSSEINIEVRILEAYGGEAVANLNAGKLLKGGLNLDTERQLPMKG